MKRVILDTNIYGRIIERKEAEEIREKLELKRDIIIYGFDVVRKELRVTSKKVRIEKKSLRLALLGIYDHLTQRHLMSTTSLIRNLADDYYETYKQLGGKYSKEELMNDFLIVACASIHELDIVVSDDNDTMLSENALRAYTIVNKLRKHRLPQFIGYDSFGRLLA